jgi:phosphatidate cytidylyltransferase
MSDRTDSEQEKGFRRPWEAEDSEAGADADADVFTLPEPDPTAASDVDLTDWEAMTSETGALDEYTAEDYAAATTEEYRGLAEEVSRAAGEEWEQQAVAASVPGVDSGLVGFEDVTGATADSEEDYEAREQAASSDLAMRAGSAIVIFGLCLGSLFLGGWWFTAFVILVMVVASGELYATVRQHGYRPLSLFGLLGVVLMGIGAHASGVMAIGGWAALVATGSVLFFSLSPRRQPLEDAAVTVGAMAWVGLVSFAILIAAGPRPIEYILFTVFLVAANDTGAYFVGRAFGRRKLAPVISPQKTVEGFFAGLIAGLLVASILVTFPGWEDIGLAKGLVAAALVGVVAPIGDAAESVIKRALDVKDMGSVLPGHGGILDRIDSFLFAVPAIYFLFRGFGLL